MPWLLFVIPEFIFGRGARLLAGRYAANLRATRVLLVTDPGVIAAGWVDGVMQALLEAGVEVTVFSGVSQNPRSEEVMAGVEVHRTHGCDVIVAVGGGSPIDCAKGISIAATGHRDILTFEGVDNVHVPGVPLICIPTTAGTSADLSQFAIISDMRRRAKIAIISKMVVPDVSLVDPETTTTMDSYLTACTGIDALVHAVEAYVSLAHSPILDLHALEAVRLIRGHLPGAYEDPQDMVHREEVMRAALHAGVAFSNASLGAVHAMSHSLGGFLDLPHGESNALLLEHVMAFNYAATPERFDKIAEAFGLDLRGVPERQKRGFLFEAMTSFKQAVGLTGGLAARGVNRSDLGSLADNALVDACLITNPRPAGKRDIEVIYEESL